MTQLTMFTKLNTTYSKATSIFVLFLCILNTNCSDNNALTTYSPKSPQEQAELDMEAGKKNSSKYKDAETKLLQVVAANPKNYVAKTLLAASQAAQGNLVIVDVVLKMATNSATLTDVTGSNALIFLASVFPEATATNIAFIKKAVDSISEIPVDKLETEMTFQKGIFTSAYAYLVLEKLKNDIINGTPITESDVLILLSVIQDAAIAMGGDADVLGKVFGTISTEIQGSSGTTYTEKLTAWTQRA